MSGTTRIALVDGDFISYRCAASCEPAKSRPGSVLEPEYVSFGRASDILDRIGSRVEATELRIYLGGTRNFRKIIDPNYKANRLSQPRPTHLEATRDFLVRKWGAKIITEAYEADDRLGMEAAGDTVICAIDKDFRQIAGEHYQPLKDTFEVVSSEDAELNFYAHMLIGDSSDNLRGVDGIGPIKAARALHGLSPEEARLKVQSIYEERGLNYFRAYRLFRILRSQQEYEDTMQEIALGVYEEPVSESEGEEVAADREGSVSEVASDTDGE